MKLYNLLSLLSTLALTALATPLTSELDIVATATFPSTNPFANVVNGERNLMSLEIENRSTLNVTLISAAGSIHDPENGKLLKNTTSLSYGVTLISGAKTVLPYNFYSEYKPREVLLKIWLNYDDGQPSGTHRTSAYDSLVTIVEPPSSFFDLSLLFAYVVGLAILSGIGYVVYDQFLPKSLKRRSRKHVKKDEISAPVGPVTTSSKTYDEDWIPAHHLKKRNAKKETAAAGVVGAASSGDESGAEKRRSARKASQRG